MSGYSGYANNPYTYLTPADDTDPYGIGYSNNATTTTNRPSSANGSGTGSVNSIGNGNGNANANDAFNYLGHNHGNAIPGFYHDPVTGMIMAQDGNAAAAASPATATAAAAGSGGTSQTDYNLQLANAAAGYALQQPGHRHGHGIHMNPNMVNYANGSDYLSQMRQDSSQPHTPMYQHPQHYEHHNHHHQIQHPHQHQDQHQHQHQHEQHQDLGGMNINVNGIHARSGYPQTQDALNANANDSQVQSQDQSQQLTQITAAMQQFDEHTNVFDEHAQALSHALGKAVHINVNNVNVDPLNVNVSANGNGNGIVNGNVNLDGHGNGNANDPNNNAIMGTGTGTGTTNSTSNSTNTNLLQLLEERLSPITHTRAQTKADVDMNINGNTSISISNCTNTSTTNRANNDSLSSLSTFSISITSLSIEPLSARDVVEKVQRRSREVVTRYLPCVEFLVLCQQELRNGLDMATRRSGRGTRGGFAMSAGQFYNRFFAQLPNRFFERNKTIMPMKELTAAYKGLESLLLDVKKMEMAGKYEAMKNAFLGGMRDGESWGLRKWLSKNGGALHICNDAELIWYGIRDKKEDTMVVVLAKILRPIAKLSFDRLKGDVPKAYQEVSSAHPYLPFFHRLESALKGLSEFDPEDDEVICLDDSDDEEDVKPAAADSSNASAASLSDIFRDTNVDSDIDDDVAVGNLKADPDIFNSQGSFDFDTNTNQSSSWRCSLCTFQNHSSKTKCDMCDIDKFTGTESDKTSGASSLSEGLEGNSQQLAELIDSIACALEEGREPRPLEFINHSDFWSNPASNYVFVLRLFRDMILSDSSQYLLDPIALSENIQDDLQRYYSLIKNPLGFRDIVVALAKNSSDNNPGQLDTSSLKKWNMFEGKWLIQAVDLVLLNTLAFIGKETSPLRKQILALRKAFWKQIRNVGITETSKNMPPRRTENSDFLLYRRKK